MDISLRLQTLGASDECPRCGRPDLDVVPRLAYINLQRLDESVSGVSEQNIPVAVLICRRCGAVQQHALGTIKLMRLAEKNPDDQSE